MVKKSMFVGEKEITFAELSLLIQNDEGLRMVQDALAYDKRNWISITVDERYEETLLVSGFGISKLSEHPNAASLAVGEYAVNSDRNEVIFRTA